MDLGIDGKVALVTAASRGIGESICQELAESGCIIVAVARSSDQLESLRLKLKNPNIHKMFVQDLSSSAGVALLISELKNQEIFPDIIINNLGGNLGKNNPLGDYSEYEQVFYHNLGVAIDLNHAFIDQMVRRGFGRICHISSISALENQGPPQYCAAKAALNAYVRSLGRFVAKDNVILTTVMPGAILTVDGYWDQVIKNRPEHARHFIEDRMSIGRFGEPKEISSIVSFLVSTHSSFMPGSAILADGGQGRTFQ